MNVYHVYIPYAWKGGRMPECQCFLSIFCVLAKDEKDALRIQKEYGLSEPRYTTGVMRPVVVGIDTVDNALRNGFNVYYEEEPGILGVMEGKGRETS